MLLGAALVFGSVGAAHGHLRIDLVRPETDTFKSEPGQSIPTGAAGFVDGSLRLTDPSVGLVFMYGGGGLVPGDTGHGNSTFLNEFWVGPNEAAAEAAGHVFCSQPEPSCGGKASSVGALFFVALPAGDIPFHFTFGPTNSNDLANDLVNDPIGAYLANCGVGPLNAGSCTAAYLGLSDNTYPTLDADFQDLVVRVSLPVPEPSPVWLSGVGLMLIAFYIRRRKIQL